MSQLQADGPLTITTTPHSLHPHTQKKLVSILSKPQDQNINYCTVHAQTRFVEQNFRSSPVRLLPNTFSAIQPHGLQNSKLVHRRTNGVLFLSSESMRFKALALEELQRHNAHANQIRSVDTLKRCGNRSTDTVQMGTPTKRRSMSQKFVSGTHA